MGKTELLRKSIFESDMTFTVEEAQKWIRYGIIFLAAYWIGFNPEYTAKLDNYSFQVWQQWKEDPIVREGASISSAIHPLNNRIRNQLSNYEMFPDLFGRYIKALWAGTWKAFLIGTTTWAILLGIQLLWVFLLRRIQELGDAIRGKVS